MDAIKMIKKFFPVTAQKNDIKTLVIAIALYLVAGFILWIVGAIFGLIPVIGAILNVLLGIVSAVLDIYCLIGIIFTVLDFVGFFEGK